MNKIIKINDLKKIREKYKQKKIGLCHGAFDIIHLGHLQHFEIAKKKVDILVISITSEKFIKKGPNNPFNNDHNRANFLKYIKFIDYIYIDKNTTAENVLNILKPNFYFKGKDYLEKDITGNLKKEIKILNQNNGKIYITKSPLMSSSKIINSIFSNYSDKQKKIINSVKNNFLIFEKIFQKLEHEKITIIGDPILDRYISCDLSGLTSKDPAISIIKKKEDTYPGGVLSIAMILSNFVKNVDLITYGNNAILKKYLKKYKNINLINLNNKCEIQKKTRYLNSNRFEKLLQVTNYKNISSKQINISKNKVNKYLKKNKKIFIADFGVGLFNNEILNLINENKSLEKYLNVQSNSINWGHNIVTKYKNAKYISLDKKEWELSLNKDLNINNLEQINNLYSEKTLKSVTMGKEGSTFLNKKNQYFCPVFTNRTVDTTGCGDAYFAITSLLIMANEKSINIPFIGNVYAGMHGQFFGNSKIVDKITLLKYLKSLLNQ